MWVCVGVSAEVAEVANDAAQVCDIENDRYSSIYVCRVPSAMTHPMKHTLHLTTRSRLQKILAGSRLQGTVSMRPRLRMPSPWSTVTSSMKAFATKSQGRKSMQTAMEERRRFPTSGFEVIETDQLVEEEELPDYRADRFYPVQLGEVFHDRYQVITKLGFGSSSTTWLARDLK